MLGGISLATDELPLPLDLTKPVSLTWAIGATGSIDWHAVELWELSVDGVGATQLAKRYEVRGVTRTISLDPTLFTSGHYYMFRIAEHHDHPNASLGDFATYLYPVETVATWSHSFTVN